MDTERDTAGRGTTARDTTARDTWGRGTTESDAGHAARRSRSVGLHGLLVAFLVGVAAGLLIVVPGSPPEAASGAPAGTDGFAVECDLDRYQCGVAEHVLKTFPYPWTTLGYSVEVTAPPDEWMRGRTVLEERRIELFMREDTNAEDLAATFAHEAGHALHQYCDDAVLDVWRDRRDLPAGVPDYVSPPHDYDSVAEDFAESFRQYLGFGSSLSSVGAPPDEEWLQLNADLFLPDCEHG